MDNTVQFLRRILPPAGDAFYCWCIPAPENDPKGRRYIQRFVKHAAQIAEGVSQCDAQQFNTYYAMASFKEKFSRKQDNVAFLKAFWIDIDCGQAKADAGQGYATKKEGATALLHAVQAVGLPLPMIVDSGNGLHAYWPLVEPIPADVWRPVAARVVAALQQEGLIADWGCSTDHSRILRPVGTRNWKDKANPKPVRLRVDCPDYTLEQISEPVSHIIAALPASRSNDLGVNSDLGLPQEPPSSLPDLVAEKCAQLAQFKETSGCLPEPQWRGGLSILKACIDGEATAHAWSSGYPMYQFAETQEKLDSIKGPYTCGTFERYNPAGCDGCKWKGHITSPIQLGRPNEIDEVTEDEVAEDAPIVAEKPRIENGKIILPTLPSALKGYRWTDQGMTVRTRVEEPDGSVVMKDVPFTDAFFFCDTLVHTDNGPELRFLVQRRRGRTLVEVDIPATCVYSQDLLLKELAKRNLGPLTGHQKDMSAFIQKWFDYARQQAAEHHQHIHFGWQETGGFLIGDRLFRHRETEPTTASLGGDAEELARGHAFDKSGTLEDWVRLIDTLYGGKGMEQYQFALAASFGAPLMRFTLQRGVTMNLYSEASGVGKTSVAHAALSVWGRPDRLMMTSGQATMTSVFIQLGTMNSLPCYLDENTKAAPEVLGVLAYDVTSGQPKRRANRSGSMQALKQGWSTMMMTSGNTSMVGRISQSRFGAEGELMRVMEYELSPHFAVQHSEARQLFLELSRCYGTAGEVFAQWLVDNSDDIEKLVSKNAAMIERRAQCSDQERHWLAGAAAAFTGAQIASKLQLIKFDVKRLLDWIVNMIVESRNQVRSSVRTGDEAWGAMLKDLAGGVIVTSNLGASDDLQSTMGGRVPPRIHGRLAVAEKKLWLSVESAKKWCAENHAELGALTKAAQQRGELLGSALFDLGSHVIDAPNLKMQCLVIKQDD
jgi:hypothetical protein